MRRRSTIGQTIAVVAALALSVVASDAEDAYAKGVVEIDLSDPAGAGASGVSVKDSTVKIGAAGVYSLSGTLNGGQIAVDTKGKVYLVLAADSTNSLADSSTGDADAAALFSNDTLVVTGSTATAPST